MFVFLGNDLNRKFSDLYLARISVRDPYTRVSVGMPWIIIRGIPTETLVKFLYDVDVYLVELDCEPLKKKLFSVLRLESIILYFIRSKFEVYLLYLITKQIQYVVFFHGKSNLSVWKSKPAITSR